jgi:hypothetical protein
MEQGKEGTPSISHATPSQGFFLSKQYLAHSSLDKADGVFSNSGMSLKRSQFDINRCTG